MSILGKIASKILEKAFGKALEGLDQETDLGVTEATQPDSTDTPERLTPTLEHTASSTTKVPTPSEWKHCDNKDYYRILFPPNIADPSKNQPGYMSTVIENRETGEVRIVPYLKVPVLIHSSIVLDPEKNEATRQQWIQPKLPEN